MPTGKIIPRILVAGRTGAGKSSLLNAILSKDAFQTGVRPTTMGFDVQIWATPCGDVEVIDSRGFAEADTNAKIASGDHAIQKGYEEAHLCLLLIAASGRDYERECQWVMEAQNAGLFQIMPIFLVVTRIDEMPPAREWNPETLNLRQPTSTKELNICAKLNYLKSLTAFKILFEQDRAIPVSSGQPNKENPEYSLPPYGVQNLQNQIFKVLPEAVKTDYARLFRRIELTRKNVDDLISHFVKRQVIYAVIWFFLFIVFTAISKSSSLMGGGFDLIGFHAQAASQYSFANLTGFIAFIFLLIIPTAFQIMMVQQIARRHGFYKMNVFTLFEMHNRYPALLRCFKFRSTDWLLTILLLCCCCNPLGIALFLTRPIAQCFNDYFYQFRMTTGQREMEEALNEGPPKASLPRPSFVESRVNMATTEMRDWWHKMSSIVKMGGSTMHKGQGGSIEERLQKLNELLAKKLISQADYDAKKREILEEL